MSHVDTSLRRFVFVALAVAASCTAAAAQIARQSEAWIGEPFGVGRITIPLAKADRDMVDLNSCALVADDGRAMYPAFASGRALQTVGEVLGEVLGQPVQIDTGTLTVYYLFRGEQPFRLTVFTPSAQHTVSVTPKRSDAAASPAPAIPGRRLGGRRLFQGAAVRGSYDRLLAQWWRQYHAAVRAQEQMGDYPPIVETYLTTMLGRRLGLDTPILSRTTETPQTELQRSIALLSGSEELRMQAIRDTLSGPTPSQGVADVPLPGPLVWEPFAPEQPDPNVQVEPIAMHVPEECFYIRYGTFSNYLWLKHLAEEHGGDISRMITLRAHDPGLSGRMERQIALKESALAKYVGDTVISDVVMLGRDLFLQEGGAVGMLFEARSKLGLQTDINSQRAEALAREKENGATTQTVTIAGHEVSLLATPDNRLRSFYAIDGDYHLVTNSRSIVARFFEAGAGKASLGGSNEFRRARSMMPVEREDTVFAYISAATLRGLVSPQYRIELQRRLQAVTDIELMQLARLAARAERLPHETVDDLVAGGFLPANFAQRGDGSHPVVIDGQIVDSLRGARGAFLPIADVSIDRVTRGEADDFASLAALNCEQWRQMDPLIVGAKRFALDKKGKERVAIDAIVAPFAGEKYGRFVSVLGPPSTRRVAPRPGDIISVQAVLQGGLIMPSAELHHFYLGVQDNPTTLGIESLGGGLLHTVRMLRSVPGYLGAWPKPGLLDLLPTQWAGGPDANGFTHLPILELWRWQGGGHSVISFHSDVLAAVVPHLRLVDDAEPAQIRVHMGDLSTSQLVGLVNEMSYSRALQGSAGNVRLLHALSQQLQVPRAEARTTAERLLDTTLLCTLGGEYRLDQHGSGLKTWTSTAWPQQRPIQVPSDYLSPVLGWFRGLDGDLTRAGDNAVVHIQLDMQRANSQKKIELPFLNLLNGKKKPKPLEELPAPRPDTLPAPKDATKPPSPDEVKPPVIELPLP